jgi:hypothetical protein
METNQILFLFSTFTLYFFFYMIIKRSRFARKNILFAVFIGFLFSLLTTLVAILAGVYREPYFLENDVGPSACGLSEYNTLKNYDNNRKFGNPNLNFNIDGRLCQGGPYTWQGNSKRAVACRKLASTPEDMAEIQRYNCGRGYSGLPGCGFKFTPMSERCNEPPSTDVRDNGIF